MYDILIIGGGPAGLTAAIYACRAGKKCLVLEATACGGQILNTDKITNYPAVASVSGPELAQNMQQQVLDLGAEIEFDKATMITAINGGFSVKGEVANIPPSRSLLLPALPRANLASPARTNSSGKAFPTARPAMAHSTKVRRSQFTAAVSRLPTARST